MQQIVNQLFNFCLTILYGRTTLANKYLFAIGVCIVILFIVLLVVHNKKGKALESSRKALDKSRDQASSLQIQMQKAEQDRQALNTKLIDLGKKYDKSTSALKAEKTKFVNLQKKFATCYADLNGKNKLINRLTKELEKLKIEQIEESQTHRNELNYIKNQMKSACDLLETKQKRIEEENKSMAQTNKGLREKDEESQHAIKSLQNDIDKRNAVIVELRERVQSLEEKLKEKEDLLELKETEMLALGEQLHSMISKDSKQRSNPFERLANW